MKKVITVLAAAGLYCAIRGKKAEAWFSETHSDITEKAVALLEKDNKIKPYNFYKNYIEELTAGSVEPDNDGDIDKGLGTHYYSCSNSKGKELSEVKGYYKNRLGRFSKSARTMLEENYTSALSLYKSGKTAEAMHTLGRALHFIEDMGCTVHTANMKYLDKPANAHYAYEKHINTLCKQYSADKCDKRLQKSYGSDGFTQGLNKLVKLSSRFAQSISKLDPKAFDDAAKSTIPVVQQNASALLLKFYDDCCTDNGNFLCDGKLYTLKNEASGLVITVTPKGLSLAAPDKELEQKLQLCIYDKGAFGLKISDGGFVSENCKGYDYLKLGAVPALFRLGGYGKKRFRISAGGTGFEKVLTCTKSGGLSVSEFEPENSAQIWIIN